MSRKKITFGILLILLSFSTILFSALPILYSNNSAGKVIKQVDVDFNFLKDNDSDYVLLYFGYVGCYTVCPPALNEISQIYKKLDKNKFTFYFVNLQKNVPKENVDQFAKVFDENFKGIYLNNQEIKKIISKLNVKFIPSMFDKYDIDHSGFLHVLKKHENKIYKQEFLYTTRPFDIDYIIKDLDKI